MNEIDKAISVLNDGGIIIYPTDTAFGIGCSLDKKDSIKKLFEIRKRPQEKAMPVLFDSIDHVREYLQPFDEDVEEVMNDFWPGALTLILSCKEEMVPDGVRGGGKTLGVRIPDSSVVHDLIQGTGKPLVGTSANFAGESTPFKFEDLDEELLKSVDYVLKGKTKGLGKSSTVIDVSKKPWSIIRQGDVKLEL